MTEKDIKIIVEKTIGAVLKEQSCHISKCPWSEADEEKLNAIKDLPPGAFRMVKWTWRIFSRFGEKVGQVLAAGLFVIVISIILAGFVGAGKLISFFSNM